MINLPNELIQLITSHLARTTISQLCLTCTQAYQQILPILYKHIELGHRTQIKQLEQGLLRNSYLNETVKEHTTTLTLKSRQGGHSPWIILSLFEQLPNIKHLYFRDFVSLPMTRVTQILNTLPRLELLQFNYCDLISQQDFDTKQILYNLTELNLIWTDFSADSIRQLVLITPNLHSITLGANHNRKKSANDVSLQIISTYCKHIKDVSISLQQIKESSLCQLIRTYGPQLEKLSIRCEGNETIQTISQYTKKLQRLIIRCNYTGDNSLMNILEQCHALTHLEMVSWPLQEVPTVVLDQLRYKQNSSNSFITAPTSAYIEGIKRTVALDRQDLQEIRRLCL